MDSVAYAKELPIKSYMGRHSAPSSPIFGKRVNGVAGTTTAGFQYASKDQITSASMHLRRTPTPLAMSCSSTHIQTNGLAKSATVAYNHNNNVATSPTVSPASSLCSSEMNLSQELQNHPLFKTPIVDRSVSSNKNILDNFFSVVCMHSVFVLPLFSFISPGGV